MGQPILCVTACIYYSVGFIVKLLVTFTMASHDNCHHSGSKEFDNTKEQTPVICINKDNIKVMNSRKTHLYSLRSCFRWDKLTASHSNIMRLGISSILYVRLSGTRGAGPLWLWVTNLEQCANSIWYDFIIIGLSTNIWWMNTTSGNIWWSSTMPGKIWPDPAGEFPSGHTWDEQVCWCL